MHNLLHNRVYRLIHNWILLTTMLMLGLALHLNVWTSHTVQAESSITFPQTGHTVSGAFLTYWQQHGGLDLFGYPISDFVTVTDATGVSRQVQWFERARFEMHPELAGTPYEVLLGLLGTDLVQSRHAETPFKPVTAAQATGDAIFFPQTGHTLGGGFKTYWVQRGGELIFGYPLSQEFQEKNSADGQTYTVQYFQRARFEYHPNNPLAYQVELGLLGSQLYMPAPPAANSPVISLSTGSTQLEIGPDQTAILPVGTSSVMISVRFPQPVNQDAVQIDIQQREGTPAWQMAPTGMMPTANNVLMKINASANSPAYFRVQVSQGVDVPSVFFGVEVLGNQMNPAAAPLLANWNDATALVRSFYNAINRQEYERAYSYWENPGTPNGVSTDFNAFVQGYASTSSVTVTTGDPVSDAGAGNLYTQVPVVLQATQHDSSSQSFYGCYVTHRINVEVGNSRPPYPIMLRSAHILSAPAGSDQASLLAKAVKLLQDGACVQ